MDAAFILSQLLGDLEGSVRGSFVYDQDLAKVEAGRQQSFHYASQAGALVFISQPASLGDIVM